MDGNSIFAGRFWFSAIERVIERLDGVYLRVFFDDRDGEDSDLLVFRQAYGSLVAVEIDRISKEIAVLVRLVQPIRGVTMRRVPGEPSRFYITWSKANVVFGVAR